MASTGMYPSDRPDPNREQQDPYEWHKEQQHQVKEYLIAVEQVKLMQERLKLCVQKSGPDHWEDCREERDTLWKKINTYNYGAPGPARGVRASPLPMPLAPPRALSSARSIAQPGTKPTPLSARPRRRRAGSCSRPRCRVRGTTSEAVGVPMAMRARRPNSFTPNESRG